MFDFRNGRHLQELRRRRNDQTWAQSFSQVTRTSRTFVFNTLLHFLGGHVFFLESLSERLDYIKIRLSFLYQVIPDMYE